MAKTERKLLYMTRALDRRVRKEAKKQGRSMNDLIEYCIEKYLDERDSDGKINEVD